MKKIDRIVFYISQICCGVSCVMLVFVMLLTAIDVMKRYMLHSAILGSYEAIQLGMLILVFFALPYGQYKKALIRVDFFVAKLPGKVRYIIWALGDVVSTVVCFLLSYAAYLQGSVMKLSNARSSILMIKVYPFYYIEAIALFLFAIILVYDMVKSIAAVFSDTYGKEINAIWGK